MKKFVSVLSVLMLSLGLVCSRPFDIYADTFPSTETIQYSSYTDFVLKGDTYNLTVQGGAVPVSKYYYDFVVIGSMENEYIGWLQLQVTYTYTDYQYDPVNQYNIPYTNSKTVSHYVYINGNSFEWRDNFFKTARNDAPLTSASFSSATVVSSNVVQMSTLTSLNDIINILNDINNYVSIDQYAELQSIVSNTSLANDYLEQISLYRQWNIPFESIAPISYMLHQNFPIYQFRQFNDYYFPIFNITDGDVVYQFTSSNVTEPFTEYNVIMLYNRSPSLANLNRYFVLDDGEWTSREKLYQFNDGIYTWTILKCTIGNFTTNTGVNKITYSGVDVSVSLLYFSQYDKEQYMTTDFALSFGYQNKLLSDLNIIANGTTQSNTSSEDLEDQNDDLSSSNSTLFNQEDSFNSSMNTNLNAINTNVDIGNFGQVFLGSANWVRTQFDNLTYSTPYGSILGYSLLLGLGLLIIGKVVK